MVKMMRERLRERPGVMLSEAAIRGISCTLLVLGILKLWGLFIQEGATLTYLGLSNPVIPFLRNRTVLCIAAIVEVIIGQHGIRKVPITERSWLLLWFASVTILYKVMLSLVNYRGPCGCLLGINRLMPLSADNQRVVADIVGFAVGLVALTVLVYQVWLKKKMDYVSEST